MGHSIMIVDDSRMFRRRLKMALQSAGHEVTEACDGQDALEKLGDAKPALIVCDVNMPRMNGLEFLEALRSRPEHGTPVLMLTAEMQPSSVSQAKRLGAKGWLIKPVATSSILTLIGHFAKERA